MLSSALRRGAQSALVIGVAALVTFALIHLAPGDPFGEMANDPRVPPGVREQLRHEFGLDESLPVQFGRWGANVMRGRFGYSTSLRRDVGDAIAEAVPNTLHLMGVAIVLSFTLGVAVALAQMWRPGSWLDRALSTITLTTWALPDFLLAIVLLLAFSYWMAWFPAGGMVDMMHGDLTWWAM